MEKVDTGVTRHTDDEVQSAHVAKSPEASRLASADTLVCEEPDRINVPQEIEKLEKRICSTLEPSKKDVAEKAISSISENIPSETLTGTQIVCNDMCDSADPPSISSKKISSDAPPTDTCFSNGTCHPADMLLATEKTCSDTALVVKSVSKDAPCSSQASELRDKASVTSPTRKPVPGSACDSVSAPMPMPTVNPLSSRKRTDSSVTADGKQKVIDNVGADPLRSSGVKLSGKNNATQSTSQATVGADPLSALLEQKKNKPVALETKGVLGFTPPSRSPWLSAQAGASSVPSSSQTEVSVVASNGTTKTQSSSSFARLVNLAARTSQQKDSIGDPLKDSIGDPLGALRDQRKVSDDGRRSRSAMSSDLFDVDGVLGRSFESQSEANSSPSQPAKVSRQSQPRVPTEAALATSLQDFLGDFGNALDVGEEDEPRSDRGELEGDMARDVCNLLPANVHNDERWSEQTLEAHEDDTLSIGPFAPRQKQEILSAWYGVPDSGSTIDVTHIVQRMFQECNSDTLKIVKADLGADVNSPDALRGVIGWRVICVKYRVKVHGHDVSYGNFREGVGRVGNVVPILTKTLANVVGATLAAGGYAVAKAEMGVRNRFLAQRDENGQRVGGADSELADSEIFQAGFNAWLTLNGIKPSVTYEPAGKAGTRLRWLYAESGGCADMPPEDIKQTPILIANHISYIDALVLTTIFGAPKVIAKSGTLNTPLIGRFAKEIGVIEVDRGSKSSRQATLDAIANHVGAWKPGDRPLLLFPEGTTSNGVDLLEFKKGAFAPGAPVRPIVICYTGKWHPANTNFKMSGGEIKPTNDLEWGEQFLGHLIHSLNVKVLPPYLPNEEEKADASLFAGNVRCLVADTYAQMKKQAETEAAERERTKVPGPLQRVREAITGH